MTWFKKIFLPAAVCAAFLCNCAPERAPLPATVLFPAAELAGLDFPPPPRPGSREEAEDLAEMRAWQNRRTAEQCAEAVYEARAGLETFFRPLGPFLSGLRPDEIALASRAGEDAALSAEYVKSVFRRKRPFHGDPQLSPCLDRAGGLAYPSGHAAMSRMHSLVLSELFPGRRAELLKRSDEVALNRVIGGVHFPSDIRAGKELAGLLFEKMKRNPAFSAELARLAALRRTKGHR